MRSNHNGSNHSAAKRIIPAAAMFALSTVMLSTSRKAGFDIASIYQLQRAVSPCTPLQWANSNDLLFDTRAHLTDNIAIIPVSSLNLSYHSS